MEFTRKKRKGQNSKIRRSWFSPEGYRIIWRKEVFGITVPACYQACVREVIPHYADTDEWLEVWGFVAKQRLYKTLKRAQADCERHYRLWSKACEATGIRALRDLFGRLPIGFPLWAKKKMNRKVYALLTEIQPAQPEDEECEANPEDQAGVSETSLTVTTDGLEPHSNGLVSNVKDADGNTIQKTRRTRLKATDTDAPSNVPSAMEADKVLGKPAKKHTGKRSPNTKRKSVSTKGSSKPGRKRSGGSRKNKSKPSGN